MTSSTSNQTDCVDCQPQSPETTQETSKIQSDSSQTAQSKDEKIPPIPYSVIHQLPSPTVIIEYCNRCRWQPRAQWMQTELLLTFSPDNLSSKASGGKSISSVMLVPLSKEDTGGRMRVWCIYNPPQTDVEGDHGESKKGLETKMQLVWDRKERERFPEMKELKQLIRDLIAPQQSLGHSDKGGHKQSS